MNTIRQWFRKFPMLPLFLLAGCAGLDRSCASCGASALGADWVVVQMDLNGMPFRCWELNEVSISNEPQSDGIYWKDPNGNLVHLSGHYNRVQVMNNNWKHAFDELGISHVTCKAIQAMRFNPYERTFEAPQASPDKDSTK